MEWNERVVNPDLPRWRRWRARWLGTRDLSESFMLYVFPPAAGAFATAVPLAGSGLVAAAAAVGGAAAAGSIGLILAAVRARRAAAGEVVAANDLDYEDQRWFTTLRTACEQVLEAASERRPDPDTPDLHDLFARLQWEAAVAGREVKQLGGVRAAYGRDMRSGDRPEPSAAERWRELRYDRAEAAQRRMRDMHDAVCALGLALEEAAARRRADPAPIEAAPELPAAPGGSALNAVQALTAAVRARSAAYREVSGG